MKMHVGIWLDHEKAYFVNIDDSNESPVKVKSGVEPRNHLAGGPRSRTLYGPQDVASEGRAVERRRHQLHKYYHRIMRLIVDAEEVFLMGPGPAKFELIKEIRRSERLRDKTIVLETTDTLTENEFVARVKDFYSSRAETGILLERI